MSDKSRPKYRDFMELMQVKEDLNPELLHYFQNEGSLGECLKHPLVFGIPYIKEMNAYYNEQLKCKQDYLAEAKKNGDWSQCIWIYERPYRMMAFMNIKDKMSDEDYWQILASIWTDTENQWQIANYLDLCLSSKRPGRENMMDEDERKFFAAMPEEFVIYRGHQKKNRLGYSWSLSYGKARWFAERFQTNGSVSTATVKKGDIYAILLGRNEFEVAIHPKKLQNVQTIKKLQRPALVQTMLQKATKQFVLGKHSCHGPWHWDKVERNAIILCKAVPDADRLVCRLFAVLHDCKRENDDYDPQHGHRAADFVYSVRESLLLKDDQLNTLIEACKYHNDGLTSNNPTIGVCWDADRLDLPRVGIAPDPALLSTAPAKAMIWKV